MSETYSEPLPFVTVYTITYKQQQRVLKTTSDLLRQDYPAERYAIVILDDGSDDGTVEALRMLSADSAIPITVLQVIHEADYLSAKRWNQCIAAATSATEVFIQVDDVQLRQDFIMQHVKWHQLRDSYLITGAKFEGNDETWDLAACQRSCLAGPGGSAAECNYLAVWGASLSFSRSLAEKVWQNPYNCPYDERMVGWGFHEIEFAYRVQSAGGILIYDPSAGVFHRDHTQETERVRGFDREQQLEQGFSRNELYMCEKHHLTSLPWWSLSQRWRSRTQ